jgi:hypothetical protein
MVIRHGEGDISFGGAPMAEEKSEYHGEVDPDFEGGSLIGKRYVDQAGTMELLCVKPGKGSLSVDGVALAVKDAKPLPASD